MVILKLPKVPALTPTPSVLICELTSVLLSLFTKAIPLFATKVRLPDATVIWPGSYPGTSGFEIGPSAAILSEGASTMVKPVFERPPSVPSNVRLNGTDTASSSHSKVLIGLHPTMLLSTG